MLTLVDIGKLVPDTDGVHLTLVHNSKLVDVARLTKGDGSITGTKISSTRYIHYGRIDFEMSACCCQTKLNFRTLILGRYRLGRYHNVGCA